MKLTKVTDRRYPRQDILQLKKNVQIVFEDKDIYGELVNISFNGLSILASGKKIEYLKNTKSVKIIFEENIFFGKPQSFRTVSASNAIVGIELFEINNENFVNKESSESDWDFVLNEKKVLEIFFGLCMSEKHSNLMIKDGNISAGLSALEVKNDKLICISDNVGLQLKRVFKIYFNLYDTYHYFISTVQFEKGRCSIDIPKKIARYIRRESYRVKLRTENIFVKLTAGKKQFKIYDISENGLSLYSDFLSEKNSELFWLKEHVINNVSIIKDGLNFSEGSIRVKSIKKTSSNYVAGFQYIPINSVVATKWHDFVLSKRYNNLSFNYKKTDHKDIWKLFDQSGYLSLKGQKDFDFEYNASKKSWSKLYSAGSEFSKRAKIVNENGIVGHFQLDRVYPKTWCAHQLAIDKKLSKIVAKEIYSLATDVIAFGNAKYLISISDSNNPWNQKNYMNFVKSYPYKDHNDMQFFNLYEIDVLKNKFKINLKSKTKKFKVEVASEYDLKKIKRFFFLNGSRAEREAMNLDENILMKDFCFMHYEKGLLKGRSLYCLKEDKRLLAFSLIDYSESGINIFGVFNSVYIYVVEDELKNSDLNDLIGASINLLQKQGIASAVLLSKEDLSLYAQRNTNVNYVSKALRWICMYEISKRYRVFSQQLYGYLIDKRKSIKSKNKHSK